jgi:hypothetical protein
MPHARNVIPTTKLQIRHVFQRFPQIVSALILWEIAIIAHPTTIHLIFHADKSRRTVEDSTTKENASHVR